MMRIAVDLPDDIAKRLETAWPDVSRGTLEAVALEGYRDGVLTRDQVGRLCRFLEGLPDICFKCHETWHQIYR